MKTIEEAAHEYFRRAQLGFANPGSEAGFISGVEFAQAWYSFKDSPEFESDQHWICKDKLILSDLCGNYTLAHINRNVVNAGSVEINGVIYTHWRAINLK